MYPAKLKGRIIEKFGSQGNFAKCVNRSPAFVSKVLNASAYLDQRDISRWANLLDISCDEIGRYFFTFKVHETEH